MYNTTYNFWFILNIILGDCPRSDYTFVADLRLCLKFYIDPRTQPEAIFKCLQDGANLSSITNAWKQEVIGSTYKQIREYDFLIFQNIPLPVSIASVL
jgi:hypothetical protein